MIQRGYVWPLRLLLVGIAVFGPSLMAFQLVSAAGNPTGQLRGSIVSKTLQLAQSTGSAGAIPAVEPPAVTAVLYTKGAAKISWNGRAFAVENGSYAYVGGERIDVAPGSMGLLRLSNGSNVFICAGSSVSVNREDTGAYVLDVARGSARFSFVAGTEFSVRANKTIITADSSVTGGDGAFEGEVQARADGGCLICELAKRLKVQSPGQDNDRGSEHSSALAPPGFGRIIETVSTGAGSSVTTTPIPLAAMPVSLSAGGEPAAAFLCQCEALKQRVEDTLASQLAQSSDSTKATVSPPVSPPEAPPVALAEPNPPDPFDPNVLPPPAAGETSNPVVVVAPPAVPAAGSGGGGIASPS